MREVALWDEKNDIIFIVKSSKPTKETINFEGKFYPLIKIEAVPNILGKTKK